MSETEQLPEKPPTVKELGFVKRAKAILADKDSGPYSREWANRILAEHKEDVAAGRSKA